MNNSWRKYFARVNYLFSRRFCLDLGGDERNTILIAGAGRSGTTWLGDLVNCNNDFRTLFEPFSYNHLSAESGFHARQYIVSASDGMPYSPIVRRILRGQAHGKWVNRQNNRVVARKRLIKEIHANLFLKWLHERFPSIPIVFIIRNPFAVALSRVQCGWNDQSAIADLLDQRDLVVDYLHPMLTCFEKTSDPFERHLLVWAVENAIPLSQFAPDEIHVVGYEDLVLNPRKELDRISCFLGMELQLSTLERYHMPSSMTNRNKGFISGPERIGKWRQHISSQVLARAEAILAQWGLDHFYGRGDTIDQGELIKYMKGSSG